MFKKIITSIILACFIFVNVGSHFASVTHAQNTWYYQTWPQWHARVYDNSNPDEIFGERYTAAQVEWVIYGLISYILNHAIGEASLVGCIIRERSAGNDLGECEDYITDVFERIGRIIGIGGEGQSFHNPEETNRALAAINPLQDVLSGSRPISGIGYLKTSISRLDPVTEVKAQGFGFGGAESIRGLWVALRNVAYFFLILLIIAMSFMIMFRFKISPQTVITVQSALPKVIIALLLITFSYAIAGFMIDLLYVVIGIIAAVFSSSGLFHLGWAEMYNRLSGATYGNGVIGIMSLYLIWFIVISISALASNLLGLLLLPLTTILWIIIIVIAIIALFFISIKILWMLIKTFVMTILLIATGPIFIIVGGFGGWLKTLASHLAVFAVIGPMFAVSFLFLASAIPNDFVGERLAERFVPFRPEANVFETRTWNPPFLGIRDMDVIWLFASFVIITLIPNVANIIKSMIDRRPFGYGTAIGAAIGAAAGTAWSPFGSVAGYTKEAYMKERGSAIATAITKSKYGQAMRRFLGG